MTITQTDTGISIACDPIEGALVGNALLSFASTLRLAAQTELPESASTFIEDSEKCDTLGAQVLHGIAAKA